MCFSVHNPSARSETRLYRYLKVFKRSSYLPVVHSDTLSSAVALKCSACLHLCSMTNCVPMIHQHSVRKCPPNIFTERQCSFSLLIIASMHLSSGWLLAFPRVFPRNMDPVVTNLGKCWKDKGSGTSALPAYSDSNLIYLERLSHIKLDTKGFAIVK